MEQTYVRKTFHSNIAHYFTRLNFLNTLGPMQSESNDPLIQVTFHDFIGLITHTKLPHTNRIDVTKH